MEPKPLIETQKAEHSPLLLLILLFFGVALCAIVYFIGFISGFNPVVGGAILFCLLISFGCFLGYILHARKIEAAEQNAKVSESVQTVELQITEIRHMLDAASARIVEINRQASVETNRLSSQANDNLNTASKILQRLEQRASTLDKLLSSEQLDKIYRAREIAEQPLDGLSTAQDALRGSGAKSDLNNDEWQATINDLLGDIELEFKISKDS